MMRHFYFFILAFLLAGNAAPAADGATQKGVDPLPWRLASAPLRLRINIQPRRRPSLFVPVPSGIAPELRHCSAFADDGSELPASPVLLDDRLIGVALFCRSAARQASRAEAGPAPNASIYLHAEAREKSPAFLGENARPVTLERSIRPLTTRAHSPAEILRLFNTPDRRRPSFVVAVPSLGAIPDRENWRQPPENPRLANALLRWDARFILSEERSLAFGADQDHCAWLLLLDGKPVADWSNQDRRPGGGAFGFAIDLKPGSYSLQLFAVQRAGENIPRCFMRPAGEEGPGMEMPRLLPAAQPAYWSIEFAEQPEHKAGVSCQLESIAHFLQNDQRIAHYSIGAGGDGQAPPPQWLDQNGQLINADQDGALICPADCIPGFRLKSGEQTLSVPAFALWQPGTLQDARMSFGELPSVLARQQTLSLAIRISWPETLPDALRQNARFLCEQRDENGAVLQCDPLPVNGQEQLRADVTLRAQSRILKLRCILADKDIFRSLPLSIIHPQPPLRPLSAQGNALYAPSGQRAVMLCAALPPANYARSGQRHWPAQQALRVAILDDLIAATNSYDATTLPEQQLAELLSAPGPLSFSRVNASTRTGSSPLLAAIAAMPQLIASRPDFAVLSVGAAALHAGQTPGQWCQTLLFLTQACQAAGIEPILVALPDLPGLGEGVSRSAALLTKELGLSLGVAVIDLYSRQRLSCVEPASWYQEQALTLPTPHNQARLWLSATCASALQQHYPAIFTYHAQASEQARQNQP
jgi:hypothetical protein